MHHRRPDSSSSSPTSKPNSSLPKTPLPSSAHCFGFPPISAVGLTYSPPADMEIKESKSLKDIPVVIMSSENIPSRINRCLEEGAEEFFLKPVQLSDVNKLKPHLLKGRDKESEPSINKRKGMEECHSHDKTRTKYDGLEVV
ncbi:hypothetical protein SO802_002735 [Lithocarpus litseifolius]|uniref:Response regulatory domain-containing protein n=1 Tax=Lithocarpus litseifolius TaxID=425828 RepID=A0AAW2E3Q9_9ROSI